MPLGAPVRRMPGAVQLGEFLGDLLGKEVTVSPRADELGADDADTVVCGVLHDEAGHVGGVCIADLAAAAYAGAALAMIPKGAADDAVKAGELTETLRDSAERIIQTAIDTFGKLDILVNNAGILRDRMLVNMTEAEWDAVIKVHLKGTFGPAHFAANYWRDQSKAGNEVDARIINTTSPSGIYGNVGQTNYGAAKAGIASFTIIAAKELGRYGVTCNAIAPAALTRMTEDLGMGGADEATKEQMSPKHIAPIVCWLASPLSAGVTGRVFDVSGRMLSVSEGWHRGPSIDNPDDDPQVLGEAVKDLVAQARPNANMLGYDER